VTAVVYGAVVVAIGTAGVAGDVVVAAAADWLSYQL
jgi:hypothetical protein